MRPNGPRRRRVDEREAAPWPQQTGQQRDAEALAIQFGLGYLSTEGYAKLAELLAHVIEQARPLPVKYESVWEIIKAPADDVVG